jgi:hypothetical protein
MIVMFDRLSIQLYVKIHFFMLRNVTENKIRVAFYDDRVLI